MAICNECRYYRMKDKLAGECILRRPMAQVSEGIQTPHTFAKFETVCGGQSPCWEFKNAIGQGLAEILEVEQ